MNNLDITPARFQRTILAISVGIAVANIACAEINEEVEQLVRPDSTFSAGIGNVSAKGQRFGMYNGLHDDGVVGLLDFSYIRRNDETGTWYRASGRNLGLNTRELHLEHEQQGNWRYFVDYNQISRVSPFTVITGVQGIGTSQLSVPTPAATSSQYTLKSERQRTVFGLTATLINKVQLRLKLQNEEKSGERMFGRGTPGSMEFLAEPIQHNTKQIDLAIDYTGEKIQLSGGYYGSFFKNDNPVLRIQGGATAFNSGVGSTGVPFDNIALPPDNHAHQFHLAGGYQFSRTTRLNFKVAKSFAIQNEDFMAVRFYNTGNNGANANTSGRTDLGGRVETTLANLSLTSRPNNKLSLLGNLRYEDRDDQSSIARYITTVGGTGASPTLSNLSGTSTTDGYNEPRSLTNWSGKLEASYTLPKGYQVTGGIDYDSKERSTSGVRVVGYRAKVDENTYRIELKRAMAETLTGSLAYLYSDRRGSDYSNLVTLNGTTSYPTYSGSLTCGQAIPGAQLQVTRCGLLQPIYMADRERQKIRLLTDWSPLDQLSLQLMIEGSSDNYGSGRGSPDIGVRRGDASLISVDATYQASDRWKFSTWLSRTESSIDQATIASVTAMSNAGAIVWSSRQKNTVDSLGLGTRGKLPKGIEVGADLIYAYDRTSYGMSKENYAAFSSAATPGSIPDITYRQQSLQFFGTYPVDKRLKVRLDYILDHRKIDDWTWRNWVYTDGTRIVANPDSTVHFVGLSMLYSFQ
jgi:MtrB/PioB family decaheme-associated outer membrane protein